mmetsp:Transcript_19539/g.47270  ORF Transcript_19539/g.47270 Transcript_19539/m.47270 type:complete len:81 (-) Transcript_19539:206-448(-)
MSQTHRQSPVTPSHMPTAIGTQERGEPPIRLTHSHTRDDTPQASSLQANNTYTQLVSADVRPSKGLCLPACLPPPVSTSS